MQVPEVATYSLNALCSEDDQLKHLCIPRRGKVCIGGEDCKLSNTFLRDQRKTVEIFWRE